MKLYIGNTIRRLRLEKDMTQEQLADALGVSFQSVSRWESGTNYPDIELIPDIAVFFGISADDLMGLTGAVRDEKLSEAWRTVNEAEKAGKARERLDLLRGMRRDFPKDPDVLWTLAYAMSEFPEFYEEQKALTEQFLALPNTNRGFTAKRNDENVLVYALFRSAPDEDLPGLLDRYSSENIDMTRTALLNERYLVR
ncbi:MAG: helix-turn-helix transcriptional regulator, partial [Clostridia bacterium]|nr:helix-turn-helix transcriptional regulator [Clostridia bacterium]